MEKVKYVDNVLLDKELFNLYRGLVSHQGWNLWNPSSDPIHDSTVTKQIGQSTIVDHYGKINCPKNEGSSSREQRSTQEFKRVERSKDLESTTGTSSGIFSDFVITFPIFLSLSCSARSAKLLNIFLVFFVCLLTVFFLDSISFFLHLSSPLYSIIFYFIQCLRMPLP